MNPKAEYAMILPNGKDVNRSTKQLNTINQ